MPKEKKKNKEEIDVKRDKSKNQYEKERDKNGEIVQKDISSIMT